MVVKIQIFLVVNVQIFGCKDANTFDWLEKFVYHLPFQTSPKYPDAINFSKVISVPEIWLTDEFGFETIAIVQLGLFLFGKLFGRAA